eukprot:863455-Pyramimonas_sp.AAC.1
MARLEPPRSRGLQLSWYKGCDFYKWQAAAVHLGHHLGVRYITHPLAAAIGCFLPLPPDAPTTW